MTLAFCWYFDRGVPMQDLARIEATIMIAAICSRFEVMLAPGQVKVAATSAEITLLDSSPSFCVFYVVVAAYSYLTPRLS